MAAKKGLTEVYVHPITDGRDTPPESGINYLLQLQKALDEIGVGKIATVIGRYYGMDRDNNWDREKLAYDALTSGDGEVYPTADKAIKASYAKGVTDEFVVPVKIGSKDNGLIKDGDVNPETNEPHTAHTVNPVPFIFISNDMKDAKLRKGGRLADIAPTMLEFLGLEKPSEMDGSSLIEK